MQTDSKVKPEWESEIPVVKEELPDLNKPSWEDDIPLEEGIGAKVEVDAIGTTAPDDPYEVRTNHSFATHPMSKGVVVLGITFAALSVGGIFVTALMGGFSGGSNTVAAIPSSEPKPNQPSITDADTLRAKLLFNEQNKEVSKFKQDRQAKVAVTQPTPKPVPVQPTPVQVAPRPVAYSAPPRPAPVYNRPVAYSAPPPRPAAYSAPPLRRVTQQVAPLPPPPRPAPQAPSQVQDPSQQWLAAANMGSYGSLPATQRSTAINSRATNYQNVSSETIATENTANKSSDTTSSSPYQSSSYSNNAGSNVIVGTKVKAKLETPIAWSGKLENPNQNFLIQLNEPLKASTGNVVVPKGAYLVAKITAADGAGLLNMSVASVLINENGQTTEKPVPNGVLLILGKDGQPLKASSQRRNTTGNDLGTVILSGAASTANLINRPTSQSVYNSDRGFSSTTTNSDPNYIAGFGSGASAALLQQMQNRNNQARVAAQSEPKVFTLKQGTSLQVFVSKSTSF